MRSSPLLKRRRHCGIDDNHRYATGAVLIVGSLRAGSRGLTILLGERGHVSQSNIWEGTA